MIAYTCYFNYNYVFEYMYCKCNANDCVIVYEYMYCMYNANDSVIVYEILYGVHMYKQQKTYPFVLQTISPSATSGNKLFHS